ncbi:hypothetical protein [Mucilaginibacter conchicola]|nr:hypothetical protein [Mucilaginibacter conchicola]
MEGYKDRLGNLADKLKREAPQTPLQEVNPVKEPDLLKEEEAQLNVWIPRSLLKQMKVHGLENDLSLKDISIRALQTYLSGNAGSSKS